MVDVDTVYRFLSRRILMLWFKFEAVIKRLREQRVEPEYLEDFEYLANEMTGLGRRKATSSWKLGICIHQAR